MNNKFIYVFPLFLVCTVSNFLYAQSWRFPDCGDLEVTKIEFIDEQHDTLVILVFNDCDTCNQHVYTGLVAYQNHDTLAVDAQLSSRPSPPNNSELDYYLVAQKAFNLSDINRIEMAYGLCDSISFSSVLSINNSQNKNFSYTLSQNYPNPFNPYTTIEFEIAHQSNVKLYIFNLNGQLIHELVNDNLIPGKYFKTWNGTNRLGEKVSSGLYIYQIVTKNFSKTKKLLLLK